MIEWADPPASKRAPRTSKFQRIIDILSDNPGKWAVVGALGLKSSAAYFKRALGSNFEVVSRRVGNIRKVYARFMVNKENA